MGTIRTRRTLLALTAASVAAIGGAALPTVSPVAATTVVVPPCEVPTLPVSDPTSVERSRTVTPTGQLVLSGHSGGWSYTSRGCRNDGAGVARTGYAIFKAPKSSRWLAYVESQAYVDAQGNERMVIAALAVPTTERQFDRARKRSRARIEVRLPKVKGVVYVTRDQAPAFTTFAKKVDGSKPTLAERAAAADIVLSAGDPFADGTPMS